MAKETKAPAVHPLRNMLKAAHVQYDKRNDGVGYKYASAEAVFKQMRVGMHDSGLYVRSSRVLNSEHGEFVIKNKWGEKTFQYSKVTISVELGDESGNVFGPYEAMGAGSDQGDKAPMKAMTSALKYAIAQCCLVSWGDDPDADRSIDDAIQQANESPPEPKQGLSTAAKTFLHAAGKVAEEAGMDGLKLFWEQFDNKGTKNEISGSPEWAAIKEKAQSHGSKKAAGNTGGGNTGAVQAAEEKSSGAAAGSAVGAAEG